MRSSALDLTELRVDVEKRFVAIDRSLAGIERDLKFIRWIGAFFAMILVALVTGSVTVAWNASAVVSEVKHQGERLDKVEKQLEHQGERLDRIEKQLDILVQRTARRSPLDRGPERAGAAYTARWRVLRAADGIASGVHFDERPPRFCGLRRGIHPPF